MWSELYESGGRRGVFSFLCADATTLTFTEPVADAVLISRALHHFDDPIQILRKMGSWISRAGICRCDVRAGGIELQSGGAALYRVRRRTSRKYFPPSECITMFEAAGLKVQECRVWIGFVTAEGNSAAMKGIWREPGVYAERPAARRLCRRAVFLPGVQHHSRMPAYQQKRVFTPQSARRVPAKATFLCQGVGGFAYKRQTVRAWVCCGRHHILEPARRGMLPF